MNQGTTSGLKTSSWVPSGVVWEYAGTVVPDGWLPCDGSAISRSQYPDLFRVIGTQHGVGDGSTTFNLPNRKGRVGVGLDSGQTEFNALGLTGGFKDKTASHTHDMGSHTHARTAAAPSGGTGAVLNTGTAEYVWDTYGRGGQSVNHSHGARTSGLGGGSGDGLQGWAAGDNHQGCQTTDRTGQLMYGGSMSIQSSNHAHGLADHRHGLQDHQHYVGNHTHADTFANPSPNVSGESSQVDPTQPTAGNLQPYVVSNFMVKT